MAARKKNAPGKTPAAPKSYEHPTADLASRPEVGQQETFRAKKAPKSYRYDSSLAPQLQWDGGSARVRDRVDELLRTIETAAKAGDAESAAIAQVAAAELRRMQTPFLEWSGKAERASFDVPTLPMFVHERLSTQAILESVSGFRHNQQQDLFGDPQRSLAEQLRAYEHRDRWVNRMILGDSMVVMNSLLEYEGMGGQIQMIYMDPPYGVKFGSNFQPFVRQRDVRHNDDADLTREPEMVQAYRDTWELGLHSYLTYLRDRLRVARDLLTPSGSVVVQISDENLHHVREVLDEVFGADNFCALITFRKKMMPMGSEVAEGVSDYLLWYCRDRQQIKSRSIFRVKASQGDSSWSMVDLPDGERRRLTREENEDHSRLPTGSRVFQPISMLPAQYRPKQDFLFEMDGRSWPPPKKSCWKTDRAGMEKLAAAHRLVPSGETLRYVLYHADFPVGRITNLWADTAGADGLLYVVQTNTEVIRRCMLMITDPGDLVLDPTCGSGTTAYVAEQWGRRWITIDTSRVPLALARQRLLTATYAWYKLKDESRGPAGGFTYERRQNNRGEDVGGLVPHITLGSIANDEPLQMEVLVDRPEEDRKVTRVTGPFVVEATIPTPVDWEGDGKEDSGVAPAEDHASFTDRMLEVLRRAPRIHIGGNETAEFEQVRAPAKAMVLSAEAVIKATTDSAAFVFGPEHGAVSEVLVHKALKEADRRNYARLYVVGFAIEPNARQLIEATRDTAHPAAVVPTWYVQATPDLMMGSLLKTTKASQLFSVCGLPDITVTRLKPKQKSDTERWIVKLNGVDAFDPDTMETRAQKGLDVPAWFLDTDYNGRVFRTSQAFFPRTQAWDALKRALKADFDEALFEHLAGDESTAFEAGANRTVAVKVIDDRGNELMVVEELP
jgi:adenine-specific DNA-methyltransferase